MKALSTRFPRNSWRTIRVAATSPKNVFAITAMTPTCRVTLNACSALGCIRESHTGPTPSANVRQKTRPSGRMSRNARYSSAAPRKAYLATTQPPALDDVKRDDDDQGQHEQHGGFRRGAHRVVRLDLAEDVHGGDLGLERDVARDQHGRSELADGPGKSQPRAGQDGGQQVGQDDPPEGGQLARSQRMCRLLHLDVELDQH